MAPRTVGRPSRRGRVRFAGPARARATRTASITPDRYGRLSGVEVARLAIGAGFSTKRDSARRGDRRGHFAHMHFSQAAVAVAIAAAESGFDSDAVNPRSGATGLWQIYPGGDRYKRPRANAAAAYRKYVTQGWSAWSVYTSFAYQSHMGEAERAVAQAGGGAPSLDPGQVEEVGLIGTGALAVGGAAGGLLGGILRAVLPILKVGAGGLGLLVVAVAIVYVAGRNMDPRRAIAAAATRTKGAVPGAGARGARRSALEVEVGRANRDYAREEARARVIATPRPGKADRIRVVSRRQGIRNVEAARAAEAEAREAKAAAKRDELAALRARRTRRAPQAAGTLRFSGLDDRPVG